MSQRITHVPKKVETRTTVTTLTCDWCQKTASDGGEQTFGGSVFGGWYHVSRTPRSTALPELQKPREWDFCGFECLSMWVNDSETKRGAE